MRRYKSVGTCCAFLSNNIQINLETKKYKQNPHLYIAQEKKLWNHYGCSFSGIAKIEGKIYMLVKFERVTYLTS